MKETKKQKDKVEKVMHEYKEGTLKSLLSRGLEKLRKKCNQL